jgi:iron complex outermembrane receptor protein
MNSIRNAVPAVLVLAALTSWTSSQAQQAQNAPAATGSEPLQEVIVTGLRFSLQQALEVKRDAITVVEVVSAEDIGKLPDKNVADALQRLPGVNISSQAAGEGGFDENDRVSIRGTSPSLTQTTINGHAVATGDWFILDQFQTVGRSVSYSLLPSELVSTVVVHKSQTADMTEGGVAGSVDILTRRPLDISKNWIAEAAVEGVYTDLPKKTEPQVNGLFAFKNDAGNFGFLAQGFLEKRSLRRDGQEFLGYETIPATVGPAGGPQVPNPFFLGQPVPSTGVAAPVLIGSALFQQDRKRYGGAADFELKPSDTVTLDLNGFYSKLDAANYNTNFMAWVSNMIGASPGLLPSAVTVKNGTLTSATWAPQSKTSPVVYDMLSRPGSNAQTYYVDFDTKFEPRSDLTITAQIGYTRGEGNTPDEVNYEAESGNTGNPPPSGVAPSPGLTYSMNGTGGPAQVSFPGLNTASNAQFSNSWAWSDITHVIDVEKYGQADALLKIDQGIWQAVKFGIRFAQHERTVDFPEDGRCAQFCGPGVPVPAWGGQTYPGNFGSNLGSGFPTNIWVLSPQEIYQWGRVEGNIFGGPTRHYWPGELDVRENVFAFYGMANFGGEGWAGNIGLRVVDTHERSVVNVACTAAVVANCPPGTISTTPGGQPLAFGPYTPTTVTHDYLNFLPSANLKFDLRKDLVWRFAAAATMARPDYSALGGSVSLSDLSLSGSGGNPNLRPIRSSNYDTTLEWYFAERSLLALSLFYMDMASYVDFGTAPATYYSTFYKAYTVYQVTSPFNTSAYSKGWELAWEQPIWGGFGVQANFTHADGKTAAGGPLVGMSNTTWNAVGYYENRWFSARLAYTYRSHFLVGLDRSFAQTEDDIGNLAASVSVTPIEHVSFTFDALNLSNATLKYYGNNTDQPRAFYSNGRQYYAGVHVKF